METNNKASRLLAAAVGIVSALSLGVAGATANAADPSYGNINQNATGSIIVHKHQYQTTTPPTVGDPQGGSALPNPISGAKFTVYKVTDLDLGTPSSWDAIGDFKNADLPTTVVSGTTKVTVGGVQYTLAQFGSELTTGSDGVATFTDLPVAAYVVVETGKPVGAVETAQPFLVTVPYPDNGQASPTNTNGWLYNVNVYPKNSITSITKSIDPQDPNLGLGSTVTFPTTTTVPSITSGSQFTHFWIQDPLDPRLTGGTATTVSADKPGFDASLYTVHPATSDNGNLVTVEFNKAGLAWLKANPGAKITTIFTGLVSKLGSGIINNTAYMNVDTVVSPTPPTDEPTPPDTTPGSPDNPGNPDNPDNPGNPDYPGMPSNEVTTNWGNLIVSKVDGNDSSSTPAGLQGAVFEIYEAATAYPTSPDSCSTTIKTGADPISVNDGRTVGPPAQSGYYQFVTDASGKVNISGLFVSDSVNAPANASTRCYVLKEVKAPTGYVLPDNNLTAVAVKIGAQTEVGVTVKNYKELVPGLPLTGSQAMVVVMAAGILVLGGAGILVLVRRRRSHQ